MSYVRIITDSWVVNDIAVIRVINPRFESARQAEIRTIKCLLCDYHRASCYVD